MKKVMFFLMIMLIMIILTLPMVAMAADGSAPGEFFNWGMLATYAGCLAATMLLTQFFKGVWPQAWPVQYLSYIIALVVLILSSWALGTLSWMALILNLFNAVIISFAANGGFNNLKEVTSAKKNE
jgi:hypothetical protein